MDKHSPNLALSYKRRGEKSPDSGKRINLYLSQESVEWIASLPVGDKSRAVDRLIREEIARSQAGQAL